MKKYQFSVDGASVSVFTSRSESFDREEVCRELSEGELAVILYPEREADYGVVSFDKNNIEPREPYLSFAALSCFFERVLGFPKMMLDIKYRGKTVDLSIDNREYKFSVNIGKSKILCTKTVDFADKIEIETRVVIGESIIATVVCNDAELFDYERLKVVLSSFLCEGVRSAMAVSYSDKMRIRSVGDHLFYEAIVSGVVALSIQGTRLPDGCSVGELDGSEHSFSLDGGNLIFYPKIRLIG